MSGAGWVAGGWGWGDTEGYWKKQQYFKSFYHLFPAGGGRRNLLVHLPPAPTTTTKLQN